jgi:hypothetical protein
VYANHLVKAGAIEPVAVNRMVWIGITEGYTTGEEPLISHRQMVANQIGIVSKRSLGAGGQTEGSGAEHKGLQEDTNIDPAPLPQTAIDKDEYANRCTEEAVVLLPNRLAPLLIFALYPQRSVEGETCITPSAAVGFMPGGWVVAIFGALAWPAWR